MIIDVSYYLSRFFIQTNMKEFAIIMIEEYNINKISR